MKKPALHTRLRGVDSRCHGHKQVKFKAPKARPRQARRPQGSPSPEAPVQPVHMGILGRSTSTDRPWVTHPPGAGVQEGLSLPGPLRGISSSPDCTPALLPQYLAAACSVSSGLRLRVRRCRSSGSWLWTEGLPLSRSESQVSLPEQAAQLGKQESEPYPAQAPPFISKE